MEQVRINTPYITLGQFLKLVNLISNGGEAKTFLLENEVLVNRELEQRRGKKLYKNDIIEALGKKFIIDES